MSLANPAPRTAAATASRSDLSVIEAAAPSASDPRRGRLLLAVVTLLVAVTGACAKGSEVATSPVPTSGSAATSAPRAADGAVPGGSLAGGTTSSSAAPAASTSTTAGGSPSTAGPTSTSSAPIVTTVTTATTTVGAPSTTKAGSPPASAAAFCARNSQATSDFESLDPTKDFAAYLAKLREVTAELAGLAPSAIKADVQTVADAFTRITTAEQIDAMTSDPQVKAASDRVTEWTKVNCPEP